MEKNKIQTFGKDHWSLFGYIGTRVADHQGRLDLVHLRIKNPALQQNRLGTMMWKPEYGTRLKGYWNKDGSTNPTLLILDHDDYDCLDDLEEAGLIKSFGTGLNPVYKLTKFGFEVHSQLLLHKQLGKYFSDFELNTKELVSIPPNPKGIGYP